MVAQTRRREMREELAYPAQARLEPPGLLRAGDFAELKQELRIARSRDAEAVVMMLIFRKVVVHPAVRPIPRIQGFPRIGRRRIGIVVIANAGATSTGRAIAVKVYEECQVDVITIAIEIIGTLSDHRDTRMAERRRSRVRHNGRPINFATEGALRARTPRCSAFVTGLDKNLGVLRGHRCLP